MRIGIVSSHINNSLQFEWFEEELLNKGVEHIHIIIQVNEIKPQLEESLRKLGVPVYVLVHKNFFSHFRNIFSVRKLLIKHKIEIVHTTLPFGNIVGQCAAILSGIKAKVTTCENSSWAHDFKNIKQEWIDKFTYWSSRKVIAVADSSADYLEKKWGVKKNKLTTIYHGLKKEAYENINSSRIVSLRKQLNIDDKDFIVGMIARLEFWKGHKYAIDAMTTVVKQAPDTKLLIFGSMGPDYEIIQKQIKELGLTNNIFYKGFINDPVALFQLFNIHLHVPINVHVENCGISIIEGMISARPQVLTLSGYAAQSARHMQNAYVVDYCNSNEIAKAILTLKNDPELAYKLGKQAKADAFRDYSNTVKTEKHLELYKSLLQN